MFSSKSILCFLALSSLVASTVACSASSEEQSDTAVSESEFGASCRSDSQCGAGAACVIYPYQETGTCFRQSVEPRRGECDSDSDCSSGYRCASTGSYGSDRRCISASIGRRCTSNSECFATYCEIFPYQSEGTCQ
jgi:hypothetical protein